MNGVFEYLQSRIRGTASVGPGTPPPGLIAFYWHFVRQTKGWYALMFATSIDVAIRQNALVSGVTNLIRQSGGFLAHDAPAAESAHALTNEPVANEKPVSPLPEPGTDDAPVATRT